MKEKFQVGQEVRYKPGFGTYGYEDLVDRDGLILATVRGYGKPQTGARANRGPRVKIQFFRGNTAINRAVDQDSLR